MSNLYAFDAPLDTHAGDVDSSGKMRVGPLLLVATFILVTLLSSARAEGVTVEEWRVSIPEMIAMELDAVLVKCPEVDPGTYRKEPDRCYRTSSWWVHKMALDLWVRSFNDITWLTPWEEYEFESGTALVRAFYSDDPQTPAGFFYVMIYTFHDAGYSYGFVRFEPKED